MELHADNPDGQLQPGAYAQVDFELPSNPNVVRIPTSALVFRERGTEVALVGPDNKIELKPITIGRNLSTQIEVLKGLTAVGSVGEQSADSLSTGDTVRVAGQQSSGAGSVSHSGSAANVATTRDEKQR